MYIVLFFTYKQFNVCCISLSIKKIIHSYSVFLLVISYSYNIMFTIVSK
jgi:hypothetical protein